MKTIQRSAGEHEWEVRLMPKVAYPMKLAGHPVTPYVANDLFYHYTRDAWDTNRVFLGVTTPLKKTSRLTLGLDLYYMLQSQLGKRRDWSSTHILGTTLSFQF